MCHRTFFACTSEIQEQESQILYEIFFLCFSQFHPKNSKVKSITNMIKSFFSQAQDLPAIEYNLIFFEKNRQLEIENKHSENL